MSAVYRYNAGTNHNLIEVFDLGIHFRYKVKSFLPCDTTINVSSQSYQVSGLGKDILNEKVLPLISGKRHLVAPQRWGMVHCNHKL